MQSLLYNKGQCHNHTLVKVQGEFKIKMAKGLVNLALDMN